MPVYMRGDHMKKWNGILKVLEVKHESANGEVLHREENLHNILHLKGEELILKILFAGNAIPANYYVGLDARATLSNSDEISSVYGSEPLDNAYARQSVPSNNFSIVTSGSHKQANSPTLIFKAAGGSWGPVKNIFLCSNLGYGSNSVLISSVNLSRNITVNEGEIITLRMGMALLNC